MVRLEFRLSMPNIGSWNGQWTGSKYNHVRYRNVSKKTKDRILKDKKSNSFYYDFRDGWGASVGVRVMNKGERKQKSAGFCGYDWMIEEILQYGYILTMEERDQLKEQGENK